MKQELIKQKLVILLNALGIFAALLLVWQLIIWLGHEPPFILPSPWRVFRVIVERFSSLADSFEITATAASIGLLGSIVAGVAVALLFAQSRWVRRMLYPYTLLLQTVPIVAVAPLILMWIGAGWEAVIMAPSWERPTI